MWNVAPWLPFGAPSGLQSSNYPAVASLAILEISKQLKDEVDGSKFCFLLSWYVYMLQMQILVTHIQKNTKARFLKSLGSSSCNGEQGNQDSYSIRHYGNGSKHNSPQNAWLSKNRCSHQCFPLFQGTVRTF